MRDAPRRTAPARIRVWYRDRGHRLHATAPPEA
jgi:hypothetical protein